MRERIRDNFIRMLHARRVAVIGASERNPFSAPVIRNLDRMGFSGEVLLVNPKGEPVYGRPTLRSARELAGPVDAAFLCVPQSAVLDVATEAVEAGVTGLVVVASGFAETGGEGASRQQALAALAERHDVALLGPNSLGFVNYVDRIPLSVQEREIQRGWLGIASVSGSVGAYIAKVAKMQGVGLSHLVLAGNEAGITIADIVDVLVDDPDTKAIGVFLETIYDPHRFAAAATRALAARKPIVVLKAGASEGTARLAAAHTGALVGDDRVFDAVARELGLLRVHSYEDLVATAVLLGQVGPIAKPGRAAITISGGSGEILSDLAGLAGVPFPVLSDPVREKLAARVGGFGGAHNPLDLTGAALGAPLLWEQCLADIAADENVGLTLCLWDPPVEPATGWIKETLASIARGYGDADIVPPLVAITAEPLSRHGADALAEAGLPGAIAGLRPAVTALSRLDQWSRRVLEDRLPECLAETAATSPVAKPPHERALLDRLADLGVPVVPGIVVWDADGAIEAAMSCYPVALKLVAPGLDHKTEVGGVRLGLADEAMVRDAFSALMAIDLGGLSRAGIVVSPMRGLDAELIVAVIRDPVWGPMLTFGLGGIWVELMADTRMLPLPATVDRIEAVLRGLRGASLLTGARGKAAIDMKALAGAIDRVARAALALGPDLSVLEINPLGVSSAGIEALDALAIWDGA